MKKLILSVLLLLITVVFLSSKVEAQTGADCSYKNYEWESYRCFEVFNSCQKACLDKAKGSYLDKVSPADKYDVCMKESDCHGKTQACRDQAWENYQTCKNVSPKAQASPPVKNSSSPSVESQDIDNKDGTRASFWDPENLPLLIGDWYDAMLEGIGMKKAILGLNSFVSKKVVSMLGNAQENSQRKAREYLETLSDDYIYSVTGLEKWQLIGKRPGLSDDVVQKLKEGDEAVRKIIEGALNKPVIPGEIIEVPGESNIKVYPWGENSSAVIESPNWENITFKEPAKIDGATHHVFELEQGAVEVKVRNQNPEEYKFGVDAGWLGVTVSRTHFYVYKNPNGKSAAVIVYEGEVQVKLNDGQIVNVRPDGDQSGIMIVEQKLSPFKLAIFGLVLVVVIAGIVWFIKRRSSFKTSKKKSR